MFVGREYELKSLEDFAERNTAGLVVCRGRRRIGKSTLIEQFGSSQGSNRKFYEFYGLAPRENLTNGDQLKHFGRLMGTAFNVPAMQFNNWHDALITLAGLSAGGKVVILLDEISWMASKDKDFPGILKGVWDTHFKKNHELILVLCGSVTSWIDKNILEDKGFMGRVSHTLTLDELTLRHANKFWGKQKHVSTAEKLRLLSVTGGVPRYLEEIQPSQTAEQNIKRMSFTPEGLLFNEFEQIFNDVFEKRSKTFKKIVEALSGPPLEPQELQAKLGVKSTGELSKLLSTLAASGMVKRDYTYNLKGVKTRFSKYRICDNYLRFYLKYIEPQKERIQQGLFRDVHLENLDNWKVIMGLQFENLVLNNVPTIFKNLDLAPESVVSAAPFFQHETKRQKACQIDLLIQTKATIYVCEIKFRDTVPASVNAEVQEKIERLTRRKNFSVRPVLIYQGELAPSIKNSGYFSRLITGDTLLNS
jgi:AAA+ ATPase superfamily predicted ATPase